GDYLLTLHEERVSLPDVLAPYTPQGRREQYVIYAVLDAMVASAFDALYELELALDDLAVMSTDLRAGRVRMSSLRATSSRLSRMRRRVGLQRGLFDRIGDQVNRLVDEIDAAADALATLIDLRLNETSYWLTVVATIFLPLTFITGFFGMNFNWMIDRIDTSLAFFILGIGGCIAAVLVVWRLLLRMLPVEADRARPGRPTIRRG